MNEKKAGGFAAKHPPGSRPDPAIEQALRNRWKDGHITCADAHAIASQLGVSPAEVGRSLDLLEGRIETCQLGLFGYGKKKKIAQPATQIPAQAKQRIQSRLASGRLACADAWALADELGVTRLEVAGFCEAMGIKIKPCQLGAF